MTDYLIYNKETDSCGMSLTVSYKPTHMEMHKTLVDPKASKSSSFFLLFAFPSLLKCFVHLQTYMPHIT